MMVEEEQSLFMLTFQKHVGLDSGTPRPELCQRQLAAFGALQ